MGDEEKKTDRTNGSWIFGNGGIWSGDDRFL